MIEQVTVWVTLLKAIDFHQFLYVLDGPFGLFMIQLLLFQITERLAEQISYITGITQDNPGYFLVMQVQVTKHIILD